MLFLQRTYLIFLAYCFLVIGHGLSQDATGNCSFDEKTLCSWSNDKHTDHFDWRIWQGSTPDKDTGPTSDHTGNGSYVYIETSHPRKYNEKARLNSPWMRGAQRMTFFYSMYGSTVESLSVYIRINGGEERIWSRHGNHLSSSWTEGCVALNYNGTYQVIIEGVTGVTSASNIAIDDINFRMNLTCVSASQTTPPETFEVNCTFDKSYCGWRNMVTPRNDEITWHRARSGNSSQSGPSGDHTGDGFYIYINASQSAQLNQSAQLLSPLIRGPKCLRFFYQMYGRGIGYLNVSLQLRKQPGSYLMWTKSGEQGDRWIMGSVDIGYTGECQVFFQASVGGNYTGGLGIDDVTLTNGLCEDESEPQINEQGNCNFDADFCFWRNDVMLNFEWTLSRYSTPSWDTGPSTDHTSGSGMYAYIETSSPRKPGDTARLQSPWMRGQQCMTFYYHMYGFTMGCIVIYIRSQATNRLKPVWLRSEDRGDQWIQGQISINETKSYQVIIDGVRGSSYQGDAALDDFSFQRGACQQTDQTTYYVSSYKGKDFRISTQPSTHNLHSEEFRFTLKHPRGNPNETPYFIYSEASSGQSFVSSNMDPSDYENFPLDVVVLNDENVGRNSRKIYLFDRINNGPMISLDDHGDVNCCNGKLNFSFYAYNVTESDHHSVSGCEPGWYKAGKSCYFFSVPSTRQWRYGRTFCHQLNADLAVVNDEITLEALALHGQEMKLEDRDFFVGLSSSTFPWMWADGEEVLTADDIWGPNEPSGDGRCGCFLNAVTWNSDWAGYGWRWNDLLCTAEAGFICEQPLALPLPMALFSLSGINGTVDMSPTGATKAVSNNITFAPGPFGNPNGSFFFSGDENSYVELNKNRQLDTRFSISVFAWVHLYNSSGPIYKHEPSSYGFSLRVYYPAMSVKVRFMQREPPKSSWLSIKGVLEADSWNFIGTTYNYHTGLATIFVNNETVMEKRIKPNMELATNSKVRIGAMKNKKLYFRGRISCVQVYDQALSVDQIFKIKARCNQTTPLTCSENFFPFHGGCFSINTNKSLNWHQAMTQCNREGGTLAKISREGLRYAFSNLLEGMTPKPTSLHLGLRSREDWTWIDGNPLNESLWMPGYPSGYQKTQSCGALPAGSSRIKNVDCGSKLNLLCQKEPVNSLSYKSSTLSSSALSSYHPSLAVDRSYTTCFRSKKESNPWWQVTLQKPLYVYSVDITDKIDCCPRDSGLIKITVSTSQTGLDPTCTGSLQYGLTQEYKMNCSPPARGSYVTVTLIGDSVSLVLCQVVVRSIEFSREANGVLREGWYEVDYNKNKVGTMREHPAFNNPPESQIILQDFDAPVNVAENYVQRLTAYLQVPESGNYTFYLSCDDSGELWKHDVTEADDTIAEGSAAKAPLISVKRWTGHLEWNKYPEQTSQPIFLDKCRLYRMEAFMKELGSGDTISVGMQQPNGEYERPISGPRLFWTYPGIRRLKVTLQDQKLSGFVGLSLRISGSYHFCCEGVHCPDCPLELNITALGQVVSVDSEINLSCVSTPFTATFNTERQPGNFTVKVSYTYVNSSEQILKEKLLGHGRLLAAVVEECYFESGSCSSWTSFGEKDKWKFSSDQTLTQYPGYFAYIDDSFKARLESPLLPWKSFYWTVGLCLRFNYLMPTKSKSSLKVLVKEADRETSEVVWQLVGYHGEEWSAAQVTWSGTKAIQVIFQGEGFLDNEMNIAIDEITVKTEQCPLSPYFAKPGFRCTDKQFSCKNGECVKKNLRCDGDFACEDGSDEDDCACPVSKFTCQGRCIPSTDMCDGSRHCSNGDDEKNCEHPCQSRHQCLDGSCIAWSNTCSKTLFCKDGTNTPSVCGSGKCHLNDLACTSTDHARCRSFRGRCTFQDGHCGLKSDRNASFDWTVFSGETPTENTGPSFDHTSYNKDGSYIFIETSQRDPGDKARLLSDELEPNETVCVQFWYHMHGSDIGSLSIYVKTNQSETLVWRLSGDQGNRWRFGETALNSPRLFKFVIEGTVYNGSKGDIAVDDLTVMDGNCEEILKQESPDCDFEGSMCDWNARGGWLLESRTEGFETSGRFAASLPVGGSEVPSTLSSPVINTHSYEWKCLRFWYFIGSRHGYDWHTTSLMVFIRQLRSDQTMFLFFADELTNEAQYAQIPLPSNYTNAQVNFLGLNELSGGQVLAIDDVSFIKQPCKQIPWKQDKERLECQQALGMANGAIFDRQISSSSHLDADHTATGSRLNNNRSWSAGSNDVNQWLQIDLGSQFTKVTRVSTQGRSDAAQWVTKYRLQYSEDGENLKYYREPGETIDKEFDGNTNQDTIVYHELNPPIRARYIRFEPEAWQNHISMRVELYGCRKDCQEALGMENGHILDGQISASSEWDSDHAAVQGRLFFQATVAKEGGWTSRYNSPQEWLQIDLGSQYTKVTRVATQGRNAHSQWVTKYRLQYSEDGENFQYYKEQEQIEDKDFTGNADQDTVVYHYLNPPVISRFIRFRPEAWHDHISMRVELYGCHEECQEALGMRDGAITDAQISASSEWDSDHAATQGRLNFKAFGFPKRSGSWSARKNDRNQWLRIDLLRKDTKVTRVATQGRADQNQWVTKYVLVYNAGKSQYYQEQGRVKIFAGNSDRNTVVYHDLNPPITARYIRFLPMEWFKHISMRVELYGCLQGSGGGCQQALGMQSGAIFNYQITASSQWDSNHAPYQARLHFHPITKMGSWSAGKNNLLQWLQIDLGSQYTKLTRVATQGRNAHSQWVTKYRLQYSEDGDDFQYYKEQGQTDNKDFTGNTDQDTINFHELNPPITARYIRFVPVAWYGHISMRVELYGCQVCLGALGMENGSIPDSQITASSQLNTSHAAAHGRLNLNATEDKAGSWSAGMNYTDQWLQIDLGSQFTKVTRVATQGRSDAAQWVTKYRLQYSEDGENFKYYREQGQTAEKNFTGNTDQDTVVYHELNPPIRARYIRFQPVAWHNHTSMRVELYGCRDERPCDISVDWCGWENVYGWKRIKYEKLDQSNQDDGGDSRVDNENVKGDHDEDDEVDPGNYEIHLPDSSLGYVSFSDMPPNNEGFTNCFWIKTKYSGFFIEYKVAASKEQNATLVMGIYCGDHKFDVIFGDKRSVIPLGVTDNTWHHVCVLWEGHSGLLAVFKDGERNHRSNGFRAGSLNVRMEGIGAMTVGFRTTNISASVVLGKLSGFNVWSYALSPEEILRMSYGCGEEAGDAKAWETVKEGLQKDVEVQWHRTCKDRKGGYLVVDTNLTHFNQPAVLVSPSYIRSHDGHNKCLKFRYMLKGPGKKTLTIYHKSDSYREIPIWISQRNTGRNWFYGQVPLSSVSAFQVSTKGETENNNDSIALAGMYIDGERNCKHKPASAKRACNENLFNMSGYFFSPSFPGYYPNDMFCTWHITVPSSYTIHLELQEFQLGDHPTCEDCFLQIFDGRDEAAPVIGKFCGYGYPPFFTSSSSHFTIVLRCYGNYPKARLKAFYRAVGALNDTESHCLRHQGCPSSCECKEVGAKIMITGGDLLTIPGNLPSNTGAVFFQRNRISQLHEKDFADLTNLEYIDLGSNILLHLDEDCFQNVSSVNTLRLNSNFLRTLPAGAFLGLPGLRVLDLGKNLLYRADVGLLVGLSHLEVLSLRSNQIKELEYGVFRSNSNMTHLYLQNNKLATLPDSLFGALSQLKVLNLSSNELKKVTKDTFHGLASLEYLYLDNNKLSKVPSDAFSELTRLKFITLDRFILCCYAKKSIEGVECESPVDEFSSCDDLMKNKTLQICIWILGILASLGNLFVIIWRIIDKEENRVHSFLLTNLAVADLLMGVYLMTIAVMDLKWRGEYFKHDIAWRSGIGCKIAGVLSMLSSEVSVLILTIITLDRFISIVFPFKFNRLTFKSAAFSCVGVWIFGVVISVIPIVGMDYFFDESGNFGFYGRSAVCLPLQLSEGTPSAGWEYSVTFFVVMNFISFTFILIAYITMFWTVKRVTRAVRSTNLNKESAMAKRLVFIVMTDFCCWMPIIIINILSLTGNFHDPDKIAYVWIAVFVLPLNSSLNPILYTFSTERTKRSLLRKRKNVTGLVMKTVNSRGAGYSRADDRLKTHDDNTLVSNVFSSPLPSPKVVGTHRRESEQVHTKLKLIEEVQILQDDIEGKRSTGYVTAWCEEGATLSMVLLKYFGKELKEDWNREADIVQGLRCSVDPHDNLLHHRWHSKACDQSIEHGKQKIRSLCSNSFLICYDFVSSSTLEDFLCDKGTVLNFDGVCAIACDVISAIERLEDHGILHNNITTNNILIGQCSRLPPITAVLGGFSRASKMNEAGAFTNLGADEQSYYGNDIEQFGHLLAVLLGNCHGSSEYVKLHEIMNLCFEEKVEKRRGASYIRELLEEAWSAEGVWDTYL